MNKITFSYKDTSLLLEDEILRTGNELDSYITSLQEVAEAGDYSTPEASINLPFDKTVVSRVQDVAKQIGYDHVKYIIHVGIGGSNFGAKAVYEALRSLMDPLSHNRTPKIIFLDTINAGTLQELVLLLKQEVENSEEILVHIVSKSGTTTETVVNTELLYQHLAERWGSEAVNSRMVVSTDEGSLLWKEAERLGFYKLAIPKQVGGRYSVFSAAHLFTLFCAGVDIEELLEGGRIARDQGLQVGIEYNPALTSAVVLYAHNTKNISMHNSFFFHGELESLGKWYQQLTGESIGKLENVDGEVVHAGITPTTSIGSIDLHSMAQLYLGGPKDKVTTFVNATTSPSIQIPDEAFLPSLDAGFSGRITSEIMNAILGGTKEAYKKQHLPFMEIVLPDISAGSIGQYMQFKMMEIIFLARLLRVNAFDQPSVEDYKTETRAILSE